MENSPSINQNKTRTIPRIPSFSSTWKTSLVCDVQDIYRYLIDDYLMERRQKLHKKDFVVVTDFMMHLKMGKRIHLCEYEANRLADGLNTLFNRKFEIPRIRHGKNKVPETKEQKQTDRYAISLWMPSTHIIAFAKANRVTI